MSQTVLKRAVTDGSWPAAAIAERPESFLVLGVGNNLLGDDGAGVRAVRDLRIGGPRAACVRLLDGGTLSFALLEAIESTPALIAVDAAQLGAAPGTVQVFRQAEMDGFLRGCRHARSVHELSLAELLDMARLTGRVPAWRALVGIQPQCIAPGNELTPAVRAALDTARMHIRALIEHWSIERQP